MVFDGNRVSSYMMTILRLSGTRWAAGVSADGRPAQGAQDGTWEVDGGRIRMVDEVGYTYIYRYELDGNSLALDLIESDAPPDDDVFQFAHYEARPFVRSI